MSSAPPRPGPSWLISAVAWLTPSRLRGQAIVLAACLSGVCAVDLATPGLLDRSSNIKFQDFLPLFVSGRLIAEGRANQLYDQQVIAVEIDAVVRRAGDRPPRVLLPNLYGPQVGLLFTPLSRFPFAVAAWIWATASMLTFFGCVYLVWKVCPSLHPHARLVAISAIAFPPVFHFFLRGQISVLVLACFTAAALALRADRTWLAGIALGFLIFKPQFLIAIPLVLLLARAGKMLAGLVISAVGQIALTWAYFGSAVMNSYFDMLRHPTRWIGAAELSLASIQMHSLRSFWNLLIPSLKIALTLYLLSSLVTIALAVFIWRVSSSWSLRFSALTLAAMLVNPHLFVYDLIVLALVLLLLVDWTIARPASPHSTGMKLLAYLAFVLPLFGPLSRWAHLQLSVPILFALLWVLWTNSRDVRAQNTDQKLAWPEQRVV